MNKKDFASLAVTKRIIRADYRELCGSMVRNSIFHSVTPRRFSDLANRILRAPNSNSAQPRIVVIVGAGASRAACGLPGGIDAANHLRAECKSVSRNLINAEIEKLSLQHNIDVEDFETILLALSKFDRPYVLKMLQNIFGRRFHPWLGYELLAHCLKHKYVDTIINFNFDEILDQSIEDELGAGAFRKIVLDGDCPNSPTVLFDDQNRLNVPLYIKPHGSASQPSSMRFTRDSYTALPDNLRALLRELFSPKHPLHILVFGHAMQSIEFNHILKCAAMKREKSNPMSFFFLKKKDEELAGFEQRFAGIDRCRFVFPARSLALDSAMLQIWQLARDQLTDELPPRGVIRHEVVSQIFSSRRIGDWKNSGTRVDRKEMKARLVQYFRDRTFVEIALAVAKAKGFVTLGTLASSRPGTYFSLYRKFAANRRSFKSLRDACGQLGLYTQGYGGQAVSLYPPGSRSPQNVIVHPTKFKSSVSKLAKGVLSCLSLSTGAKQISQRRFKEALQEMYDGDEVEVSAHTGMNPAILYENAEVLSTFTALKLQTLELMTDETRGWDALVCTAKSGQWLLRKDYVTAVKRRKARIALVVADMSYEEQLREAYGDYLEPIRCLRWWSHNQHVTVFLKGGEPRFAISFVRRMRSSKIAPLYLSAHDDVKAALNVFVAYWLKAHEKRKVFDEEIRSSQLRSERRELLNLLALPSSQRRPVINRGRKKNSGKRKR